MLTTQTVVFRLSLALDEPSLAQRQTLLSTDELAKAARFVVPQPRIQYIACRSALRILLANELGCQPSEVQFEYQRYGKPQVALRSFERHNATARLLHFNVSHSGRWGLIALSQSPVGIDLERFQPRINAKSLITQVLSECEKAQWHKFDSKQQAEQIIRLWVCKEALLKAMGLGIAECLQQVSFQLPISEAQGFEPSQIDPSVQIHLEEPANCSRLSWVIANNWRVQPLAIDPDYCAAIVTSSQQTQIRLQDFSEDC